MSDRYTIPQSISKTAIDSLHAKLSAVDAGWLGNTDKADDLNIIDGYIKLLEQINDGIEGPQSRRRRQTPLVNAGYAARMAVMTFILEKWIGSVVSLHHENELGVNVVALGCGLDALGIWSKNVFDHAAIKNRHHTPRLNVYEVDSWDNCMLKQHALVKSGILQPCRATNNDIDDDSAKESSFYNVMEGPINEETTNNDQADYHLIAMDFRDICHCQDKTLLKKALFSAGFDPSKPTIILSELVLAYIGYESTNAILQSIASDLLCNEFSMFTCLEPMLPTQDEQQHRDSSLLSVRDSYARDYAKQFLRKLNRGTSSSSSSSSSADDEVFHPLGSSRQRIISRLIFCGFSMSNIDAVSLRRAVATVACTRGLRANEPFDEHAALALNLECYAVACAFAGSQHDDVRCLLPWVDPSLKNSSTTIKITNITESSQDTLVGELYGRVYTHLYQKYPAIHKMVKSALKSDLMADSTNDSSAIQHRFNAKGGDFWIARDLESCAIVGCIGIRKRTSKEVDDKDDKGGSSSTYSVVEYEIQRLAVDEEHRGKGIGKNLLNAVYEYSLQQGAAVANSMNVDDEKRKRVLVKLCAVTPDILVNANNLYSGYGFIKEESFEAGLTMNVYCMTC